jgi:hypothetical protein
MKEHVMRISKLFLSMSAVAGLAIGGSVMAKELLPGQWELTGSGGAVQQICIVAGGTWYGTTFAAWGGQWSYDGTQTVIYGNYSSGAGNDVILVDNSPVWTEWLDDLSYQNVQNVVVTHVKKKCDSAPVLVDQTVVNPAESK